MYNSIISAGEDKRKVMTSVQQAELDVYKDIPGYRAILKAVLKNQIQLLVSCLCFFFLFGSR